MRKIYPYLEESYYPNLNKENEKQQFLYSESCHQSGQLIWSDRSQQCKSKRKRYY